MKRDNRNEVLKVSKEGIMSNNFVFYLADMIEGFYLISENEFKKAGLKMDAPTKSALLRIKYACNDLRKRTTETPDESQIIFGEEADLLKELIILAVDRTGDTDEVFKSIIESVRQMESKHNLNLKKFGI